MKGLVSRKDLKDSSSTSVLTLLRIGFYEGVGKGSRLGSALRKGS